jgi:hypothetical protein
MVIAYQMLKRLMLALFALSLLCGCRNIPNNWYTAPKTIQADGSTYLACEGVITLYSPSRGIVDSSSKSYELLFTDDYGQQKDIKSITSYSIEEAPDAHYAMPDVTTPENMTTTYSNGTPMTTGSTVFFGQHNGDQGRAIWNGPGKWSPVPCR